MRLLNSKIPGRNRTKFIFVICLMIATSIFAILCQLNHQHEIATFYGTIGYSLSYSLAYPLLLLLPVDYGISLSPSQTANILICTVFSSVFLPELTRIIMKSKGQQIRDNELKVCTRCIYDESLPSIHFNENGVCNYCLQVDKLLHYQ